MPSGNYNSQVQSISGIDGQGGLPDGMAVVASTITTTGNVVIGGTLEVVGGITEDADVVLSNGKALKTDTTTGHTAKFQAYDVDGTAYKTFMTLTNGNTPSLGITAPSGGTIAVDGAVIGANTAAAATVTALVATTVNGNTISTGTGTLTLAASSSLVTSGAYAVTLTATNTTGVTLPTTGTLSTLAGAETFTNKTITGAIYTDMVRSSAQKDSTTATLAAITGLSVTVVPGTYKFRVVLPGLADGTGGVKYAFKYTTAVITTMEATGLGYTAAAVAVQHTTTATDEALLFDQAAAVIMTIIEGTAVVGTGGTVAMETAQHTNNGTSSTYVGASMQFTRIA